MKTDRDRSAADTFKRLCEWDRALKEGDIVEVAWTNSHRYFSANARVVRVNDKSVRAALLESVAWPGEPSWGYAEGREVVVPRFTNFRNWTEANGAHPPATHLVEFYRDDDSTKPVRRVRCEGRALAESLAANPGTLLPSIIALPAGRV